MKMKKIIAYSLLICFTFVACKKDVTSTGDTGINTIVAENAVPTSVLTAFNDDFSNSTEREWIYGADDDYTCQFNLDDKRQEAEFDEDGHKSSQSTICIDAAVPSVVLQSFRSNFSNDIIYEWKLTSDNEWKAHFLRNGVKWEVTLNSNGTIIKSEHE